MREHGIEPIDLLAVNLYPFAATVARLRLHLRGGGREHRHRRPCHGPGGGQESRLGHRGGRSRRLSRAARRAGGQSGRDQHRHASTARGQGVRAYGAIRFHGVRLFHRRDRRRIDDVPQRSESVLSQAPRSSIRRESAPAGGVLHRSACDRRIDHPSEANAGQGAVLQQHRRQRHRARVRAPVRHAGVRHREARKSLRRGDGVIDRSGLR